MGNNENGILRAQEAFDSGFNCAQSVAVSYSERFGVERDTIATIATAFGGGIARSDNICGAVSGALMIIGLKIGSEKQPDAKARTYTAAHQFIQEFARRYGSVHCTALLGYNLSDEEERKAATDAGAFSKVCSEIVGNACSLLEEFLEETDQE